MNGTRLLLVRLLGRGVFKAAALAGAFVIVAGAWIWDADLLTGAADANLRLIKLVAGLLPAEWGARTESALRIFGADRALLLIEAVAIAKIVMLGLARPFRRRRPGL